MGLFRRRQAPLAQDGRFQVHMHIVAHADDDLYFMSPDLLHSLRSGIPVVGIYLCAGEADGRNIATNDPKKSEAPVDFDGYVGARYNGLRAAYAKMVTNDRVAEWTRRERKLSSGTRVEVAELVGEQQVTLIFFSTRRAPGSPTRRLRTLWNGGVESQPTLCPTGGPVAGVQELSRSTILDDLRQLLSEYQPGLVRIMDLDPDHTSYDADKGAEYCDNEDHTAAAMFAQAALDKHRSDRVIVESYRGYWNKLWPHNLSARLFAQKKHYIDVYGAADDHVCPTGDHLACGDLQLGNRAYNRGYGQSTIYRFPGSTTWLQPGPDGRLRAFAVRGGRAVMWIESAPGSGEWSTAKDLGGGQLAPQLNVVRGPGGRLSLVAMRVEVASSEKQHRRELLIATQEPSGKFGGWDELGNPYNASGLNPIKRREVGMPVLGIGADGRRRVFVRNFGSGLSSRACAADGRWGNWEDLRGTSQDGIAVVTTASGRMEAYCATKTGVLRWYETPNGVDRDYSLLFAAPAGPPTLVQEPDGRLVMVVRQPSTGWVLRYRQLKPDGDWDPMPQLAGRVSGYGLIAACVAAPDLLILAQRDDDGQLAVCWQPLSGDPAGAAWTSTGPLFAHAPALALDASGAVVLATIGVDGCLNVASSTVPGEIGPWQRIG